MFRRFRILLLLILLSSVALAAWRANSRLTAWQNSIHVAIYPIAADTSAATRAYVDGLSNEDFAEISQWLEQQSRRYGKSVLQPVIVHLAPPLSEQPPLPPKQAGPLDAVLWSLKLRWWAGQHDAIDGPQPHIRLFVLYHDPDRQTRLAHSTGLAKGQLGLIHAFASQSQHTQNAVVISHELLHIFGASDKYDVATLQPLHPAGYAAPEQTPLLPQHQAEIMGARIPISEQHAEIPESLQQTLIGPETAGEIGLLKPAH